jgi:hypothetical protein
MPSGEGRKVSQGGGEAGRVKGWEGGHHTFLEPEIRLDNQPQGDARSLPGGEGQKVSGGLRGC